MAAEDAAGEAGGRVANNGLKALGQKVGPLPLWVWVGAAVVIFWFVSRKSSKSGGATDPAGSVGTIDPKTGYVYGSSQDQSALGNLGSGGQTNDTTGGGSGSTTAGQYQTNDAWARAAVNYLVGLGVDATQANEAVQQYLSSQQLTQAQQADINLVIQGIGSPPQLPGPVGTAPGPIVNPPGGSGVYAANPPNGLSVSGSTPNTVTLRWNAVANASGYTIKWGKDASATGGSQTSVESANTTATVGGLDPGTLYYFQVQASPARSGAAYASATATTPQGTTTGGGAPQPQYATVIKGWPVRQWILDIAAHGPSPIGTPGSGGPHPDFTFDKFVQLNPGALDNIDTRDQSGKFKENATYRIA